MTASPVEVQPGVWLSGIDGLGTIQSLGITHVISVINWQPNESDLVKLRSCTHLHLDIEDIELADILQHLPTALAFIKDATSSGGSVLIHCNQGVSRSAAIATAYLMKSQNLGVAEALAALRSTYPAAAPNSGFLDQLKLFHSMGCFLDSSSVEYKRHRLEQAGVRYNSTGILDAETLSHPSDDGSQKVALYRCRKCRVLIATAHNVVETEQGAGETAFSWRKRDKYSGGPGNDGAAAVSVSVPLDDGSLFVEPLRWMSDTVQGAVQGKLYCPKCSSRLGSFNWSGTQTATGTWVTPAFQLHLGKLDSFDPQTVPQNLIQIRQPKILPTSSHAPATKTKTTINAPVVVIPSVEIERQGAPFFTHLILDCDGVLVDSERASCESLYLSIKAVTGFEIPHDFPIDYRPVFGMDVTNCVRYYKERYGKEEWGDIDALGDQVAKVKEAIYKDLTKEGVTAFPGVRQLVAQAKSLGMGVAVASSGIPEKIAHNLGTAGLLDLFHPHLVVSAKYVPRGKPFPDVYLEALKRVGCTDPSRAAVIEDAVNGLKAAREAGCWTIGVTTSLPREVLEPHADLVVESIAEVVLRSLRPQGK